MDDVSPGAALGSATHLPISALRLDPLNPRIDEDDRPRPQERLAAHLADNEDALQIAQSIVEHGYFPNEHLVVMPDPDEAGMWTVLEGNRRLTALLGLTSETIRNQFDKSARWDALAASAPVSAHSLVPVVTVKDRSEAVPLIGFRHISGIKKWDAHAQARYVAFLAEDRGMALADIAKNMGITVQRVNGLYRDYAVVRQARSAGIKTTVPVEKEFSRVTVAMSNKALRDHIGAPAGSHLRVGHEPVPSDRLSQLEEVLGWLYGRDSQQPLVSDTRQIKALGDVVAHERGIAALRASSTLEDAQRAVEDAEVSAKNRPAAVIATQLATSLRLLNNALAALESVSDSGDLEELRCKAAEVVRVARHVHERTA